MMRCGITTQKVLLLLFAGITLGLTRSPRQQFRILKNIRYEWKELDRKELNRSIRRIYESKLVHCISHKDGTIEMVLNREGKRVALRYSLETMKINNPVIWDKKWRVILFDVPEYKKRLRDALRFQLKQLGLVEFQKSVFVHPYECKNEIDIVIELYNARRYVRFLEATHIDSDLHLKKRFKIHDLKTSN